jgi:hypothetical protein
MPRARLGPVFGHHRAESRLGGSGRHGAEPAHRAVRPSGAVCVTASNSVILPRPTTTATPSSRVATGELTGAGSSHESSSSASDNDASPPDCATRYVRNSEQSMPRTG